MAKVTKKKKAVSHKEHDNVMESKRVRRGARELYTNDKAAGKIPKGMTFGEWQNSKFFKAAETNRPAEAKRKKFNKAIRKIKRK
jgi:hypothetical protein